MPIDAILWLDGIPGESQRAGYEKWIDLLSFSYGTHNAPSVHPGKGGMAAGRADLTSFHVAKYTDSSSPILFESCCTGKHLKMAKVVVQKAGGKMPLAFLKYDFKDVFIEGLDCTANFRGDVQPGEDLRFVFGSVEISYTPQTNSGGAGSPIRGSYDVLKGTK